jgi:hypothetical protein
MRIMEEEMTAWRSDGGRGVYRDVVADVTEGVSAASRPRNPIRASESAMHMVGGMCPMHVCRGSVYEHPCGSGS